MSEAFKRPNPNVDGKSAEELVRFIANGGAQPGSNVHEAVVAALELRITDRQNEVAAKQPQVAEAQRDAAVATVRWTKAHGIATAVATTIALVALVIAAL